MRVNAIMALHPNDEHFEDFPTGDAAVEHAREQAQAIAESIEEQGGPPADDLAETQVVALIAYLQRLGTDLNRAPDVPEEAPADSPEAPAEADAGTAPTNATLGSINVNGGR